MAASRFVVLNDGETFTAEHGCRYVVIDERNDEANEAAEQGDGKALVALADADFDLEEIITLGLAEHGRRCTLRHVACSEKRHRIPHTKGCEWA